MMVTMIHGFFMALADSVPGVSGSTIAFIMGFYEDFLTALHRLFGKDPGLRREGAWYLLKFAAGWGIGMGSAVLLLSQIFEGSIYFLSSLFLGLTVFAIPFILYEEREALKGRYRWLIFTLLGGAFVVLLTAVRGSAAGGIDFQKLSPLGYGYLFLSGVLAVSTMLLPGVSGSTMLLILGIYGPAIGAVRELLGMQLRVLPGLIALGAGAIAGVIFVAKGIRAGLRRFRPQMVYLVLGLMLGSLYAIVMGPAALAVPKAPVGMENFHLPAFFLGIAVLGGLEWMKRHLKSRENMEE